MLNNDIARRFVENLSLYTKYNVNVMNQDGTIIASVDPTRIGSFHETAHNMIKAHQDSMEVTDNESYLGVKKGSNLLVYDDQTPVGVVGVTGDPDEVRNIAYVVKMALESMLKYEHQQESLYTMRTAQDRFAFALFNEKNANREKLEGAMHKRSFGCVSTNLFYQEPRRGQEKQASAGSRGLPEFTCPGIPG